jgi:DNA-binding transcriptional ArsR family regulator
VASARAARAPAGRKGRGAPDLPAVPVDRLIHEPLRLAIVSALAATARLTFGDLKRMLAASDGNLSVHARRLEEAGYVACEKTFDGRVPRTTFRITAEGRRALERYLGHMEALIAAHRDR